MPPKRSKSTERERKRKYRAQMSEEKRKTEKRKLRERMSKLREKKSAQEENADTNSSERERKRKYREKMSEANKNIEKEKLKNRMRKLRESKTVLREKKKTLMSTLWKPDLKYFESELYLRNKEMDRIRIKERRARFNDEERRSENLKAKLRIREIREKNTMEETEAENKKAKMRMKIMRSNLTDQEKQSKADESRERMRKLRMRRKIMEIFPDETNSDDDESDKGNTSNDSSEEFISSDIVKKLNEEHRQNIGVTGSVENENTLRGSETGIDECFCDYDIDCPYCAAQLEAEKCCYTIISKEESERYAKEELEQFKNMLNKLWLS